MSAGYHVWRSTTWGLSELLDRTELPHPFGDDDASENPHAGETVSNTEALAADEHDSKASGSAALETAIVLLRANFPDRIPRGALGPDSVPWKLLAVPIAIATEDLVKHMKTCKRPHCKSVPESLLRYTRMRPDAIKKAPDEVHKVLWLSPKHGLVSSVRKRILADEPDLVDKVTSGRILQAGILRSVLEELDRGVVRLAAVLWASEFAPPESESLFRTLVPLVQEKVSIKEESAEAAAHLKVAKKEIRRLEHELQASERRGEEMSHGLQARKRALERVKPDIEEEKKKSTYAQEQLEVHEEQAREAGSNLRLREAELERVSKINAQLRYDLRCQQDEFRSMEQERGDLARKLASQRRAVENTQRQLDSIPTGPAAVRDFLDSETARISNDRLILSGGAKTHAEQEWTAHRKWERAFLDAYTSLRDPPPLKIRPKNSLRLVTLGGSSEVGRSCYLLELGEHRILVDCGIKPGSPADLLPAIDGLDKVDGLILTHVHTDHVGWLPALVRRFPLLNIYCSEGTAALLPVVLEDCHQHYMRKLAKRREVAQYSGNKKEILEDYDVDDVLRIPKHAIACAFDHKETLFGELSVTFFRAGHILGAASVLVEDQSGRRVFVSGDFASFPQLTIQGARWPDEIGEVDLLVLESTYGSLDRHDPLEQTRERLLEFIREVTGAGGSVILASFAIGRAQELLRLIVDARKSGDLAGLPVYVDGMINRVNPIYRKFADFSVGPETFNEVSGETERQEAAEAAQSKPAIIVTTSGMLAGGPVVKYASQLLPDPRHRIVLTGYQDETAPSKALIEMTGGGRGARTVRLEDERKGQIEFVSAHAAKEFKLSAHADRAGLIDYSLRMRPRHIALVHGEQQSQKDLAHFLRSAHPKAEIVCGPDTISVP